MRKVLQKTLVLVVLAFLISGVLPAAQTHASTPLTFTFLGTHPEAAAQSTSTGRKIQKLEVFNNKLYIGYGDYGANTGPMKINPYDLTTHAFTGSLWTFNTEQMSQFRVLNGKIYAPSIDPTCGGFCAGGYAVGEPWSTRAPVNVVHVYDMATLDGTDLWMVGASNVGARAWRSTDGGANWSTVQEDTSTVPNGYERYYWIAALNGKIYFQADYTFPATPMRIFDGTTWTTGTTTPEFGAADTRVVVFKDKLIANWGGILQTFDGTTVGQVPYYASYYPDIYPSDGYLYALASFNGSVTGEKLVRTTNLINWEVVGNVPTNANALAINNGTAYVGTTDSKIYSAPLPVADPVVVTTPSSSSSTTTTATSTTTSSSTTKAAWIASTNLVTASDVTQDEVPTATPQTNNAKTPTSAQTTKNAEKSKSSTFTYGLYAGLGGLTILLVYGVFLFIRP